MVVINQVYYWFIPMISCFPITSGMTYETVTLSKFLSNGKYFWNQFARFWDLIFTNILFNSSLAGAISWQILSTLVPQVCFDSHFVLGLDFHFFLYAWFLPKKMKDSVFQKLASLNVSFTENVTFQFPEKVMFNTPKKEHFNFSKIAKLISRKDKFQSPENWNIVISQKEHISISENDTIKSPEDDKFQTSENASIVTSPKWHISISKNDTIQSPKNGTFQSPEHNKFQSPGNWNILISRKPDISISRKWHISISQK